MASAKIQHADAVTRMLRNKNAVSHRIQFYDLPKTDQRSEERTVVLELA